MGTVTEGREPVEGEGSRSHGKDRARCPGRGALHRREVKRQNLLLGEEGCRGPPVQCGVGTSQDSTWT